MLALLLVASALLLGLTWRPDSVLGQVTAAAARGVRHTTRNLVLGPPRVGLQVGHLHADQHPEELAVLRWSTGASVDGLDEVDVNLAVAEALAGELELAGVRVDLLPATVPPRYRADLLISLHADSSPDPGRNGYKSAHFEPARNPREPELKRALDDTYLVGSGLADDHENVSGAMLGYYAFNPRFRHSVHRRTPAVIVELGYISHPRDRAFLSEPDRPAALLAAGVLEYLASRGRIAVR